MAATTARSTAMASRPTELLAARPRLGALRAEVRPHATTPPLDPALFARAQARLGLLCRVMQVVFAFGMVLTVAMYAAGSLTVRQVALNLAGNGVLLGLSWGLARRTRGPRMEPRRLARLQGIYEVGVALFISIGTPEFVYASTGKPPIMSLASSMIILFPLVVPLPPRRTFWNAVAAAAMAPVGLLVLHLSGGVRAAPIDYLTVSVIPAMSVVMAVLASRVVHALTVEVTAARQMGAYRLVDRIGEGGMGEVWRGDHARLARPAAIKLIRPTAPSGRSAEVAARTRQRFEREAQVTASLGSPHTVELYDYGAAEDGTVYYVMELLDGFDLEVLVKRFGPLPPARVVGLLLQACDSLAEAHRHRLVHRDIKPANLHVGRRGVRDDFLKVLDFGLVALRTEAAAAEGNDAAALKVPVGTPAFMAPEATEGEVDARSDLYSLGCVGWFLLTGAGPFTAATALATMLAHRRDPLPRLASCGLEAPGLEAVLHRCLAKRPADRYPDAEALAAALAGLADAPELQSPPFGPAEARAWWDTHAPAAGQRPSAELQALAASRSVG